MECFRFFFLLVYCPDHKNYYKSCVLVSFTWINDLLFYGGRRLEKKKFYLHPEEVYFSCDRKVSKYPKLRKDLLGWELRARERRQNFNAPAEKKVTTLLDFAFLFFTKTTQTFYSFQIIETNEIFHVELLLTEGKNTPRDSLALFRWLQIFSQY